MNKNKAQQEIVGFVLIVVLVVIGMMIYLVISLRDTPESNSFETENLLDSMMKYTTECSINDDLEYNNLKDLFKNCYESEKCNNLGKTSCSYLNETLTDLMREVIRSETKIEAYELTFFRKDESEIDEILELSEGNCTGQKSGAEERISSNGNNLHIQLKVCNP